MFFVVPLVAVLFMAGQLTAAPVNQEVFSFASFSTPTVTTVTSQVPTQDSLAFALEEAKENGALSQQVGDLQKQVDELSFRDAVLELELEAIEQQPTLKAEPFDEDFSTPCPADKATGPVLFDDEETGVIDFSFDNTSGQIQFAEIGLFVKGELVESYAVSLHHYTDHRVYLTDAMIEKWVNAGQLYVSELLVDDSNVREIAVNMVNSKNCVIGVYGTSVKA